MRGYHRVFITLQEDTPGYAAEGRPPQGRCVAEARYGVCGVKVYVQDLRPQVAYKVYLISSGAVAGGFICLGGIAVNERCRGEGVFEVKPDSLTVSCPIETYDAAAVVAETKSGAAIVLSGGAGAEGTTSWRHRFLRELSGVKTVDAVPITEKKPETVVFEPEAEAASCNTPIKPSPCTADEGDITERLVQSQLSEALLTAALMSLDTGSSHSAGLIEQFATETIPPNEPNPAWKETAGMNSEDDPHLAFKAIIQRFNNELDELAEITSVTEAPVLEPAVTVTADTLSENPDSILKKGAGYQPFGPDGGDWSGVTLNQLAFFPVSLLNYELNAFIASSYYRYGHLLVAKTEAGYVLAAPGSETEDGEMERLGFKEYKKANGGMGYWIMNL